jgi:hypothetical protein
VPIGRLLLSSALARWGDLDRTTFDTAPDRLGGTRDYIMRQGRVGALRAIETSHFSVQLFCMFHFVGLHDSDIFGIH